MASNLSFRCAVSESEVNAALSLCKEVFHNSALPENDSYKDLLWRRDPEFAPENLFLALDQERVIGSIRLVPRKFHSDSGLLRAGCLSSVCVHPEYRGQGVSRPLNELVIRSMRERGYDLAYLIARRAVDGYYNRFGFWGLASYQNVTLRKRNDRAGREWEFDRKSTFSDADLPIVSELYQLSYSGCFGQTHRTPADWQHLAERLRFLPIEVLTWRTAGVLRSYALVEGAKVLELGCHADAELGSITSAWRQMPDETNWDIPHDHGLWRSISSVDLVNFDLRWLSRSCVYGGHMFRDLRETATDLLSQANALDALVPGLRNRGRALNISFPDQL